MVIASVPRVIVAISTITRIPSLVDKTKRIHDPLILQLYIGFYVKSSLRGLWGRLRYLIVKSQAVVPIWSHNLSNRCRAYTRYRPNSRCRLDWVYDQNDRVVIKSSGPSSSFIWYSTGNIQFSLYDIRHTERRRNMLLSCPILHRCRMPESCYVVCRSLAEI